MENQEIENSMVALKNNYGETQTNVKGRIA